MWPAESGAEFKKEKIMTDAQKRDAHVAGARRHRKQVESSGVSADTTFKCANCNMPVRWWVVGGEVRPVALNILGEQCRKSKTGFHSE